MDARSIIRTSAAKFVNPSAAFADPFDDATEILAHLGRRMDLGFHDVKHPEMVQSIGHVDLNACQLGQFFLSSEAKPSAPDYESAVAIDIEALLTPQPFLATSQFQLFWF